MRGHAIIDVKDWVHQENTRIGFFKWKLKKSFRNKEFQHLNNNMLLPVMFQCGHICGKARVINNYPILRVDVKFDEGTVLEDVADFKLVPVIIELQGRHAVNIFGFKLVKNSSYKSWFVSLEI